MGLNLEWSTLATAGIAIFGVGGTWAVLGYRVRALETEKDAGKKAAAELLKKVDELGGTLEHVRQSQGARLGKVEDKVSDLRGRLEGFATGLGRRTRTKAEGERIADVRRALAAGEPPPLAPSEDPEP